MELREIVKESWSYAEVARKLEHSYVNGDIVKGVRSKIEESNLSVSHFNGNGRPRKQYIRIIKVCPICEEEFETLKDHSREKVVCSHSCSNTYFRSGPKNGNWNDETYRSTCFYYHKEECIICGEDKAVDAHHLDGNSKNNKPDNLIPLCPTHHRYCHSRFKYIVEDKIDKYMLSWKERNF